MTEAWMLHASWVEKESASVRGPERTLIDE